MNDIPTQKPIELTSTPLLSTSRLIKTNHVVHWISKAGIFLLVAILIAAGRTLSPDFLTPDNLMNMLLAVTLLGIVSVGVTFITYSGNYVDLSIPSMMALSGIVTVVAMPLGFVAALICGMFAGTALGAVNGIAVGYIRLNPIIWTLASGSITDGLIRWGFGGNQVYPNEATQAGSLMLGLYADRLPGGLPVIVAILIVLVLIGWFLMNRTSYGAKLRLVGSAYETARMSGINVRSVVALAFITSAVACSIGGILLTSLNKVGASYIGSGYDFSSITAVVIGGVTLNGGRGTVLGAVGGVIVIGLLRNIMTLMGVGAFGQVIVQGFIFIAAVGLNSYSLRRSGRDDS